MTLTEEQKQWLEDFQSETGFDCMYIDEFEKGEISFDRLARRNFDWLRDWVYETITGLESTLPESEELE